MVLETSHSSSSPLTALPSTALQLELSSFLSLRHKSSHGTTHSLPNPTSNVENRSRLHNFLKIDCKTGNVTLHQAVGFFDYMIRMHPTPPISSFNVLLGALAKNKHYDHVILLCAKMGSVGLFRDFITMNILLNCFCGVQRVADGFVVLGHIFTRGWRPNVVSFNILIRGLCMEDKIEEAVTLLEKMGAVGCPPNVVTYTTLISGLCRTGKMNIAVKFFEEMTKVNSTFGINCKPDLVCYSIIIDGFCKDGLIHTAKQLFVEMKERGIFPNVFTYTSLIRGLCFGGEWEEAEALFSEMSNSGVNPNVVTFNTLIDALCKEGKMKEANELYDLMVEKAVTPKDGGRPGLVGARAPTCRRPEPPY